MSIERGEIYFVDLNPVKGREQSGKRPVLVLSINAINRLPLVVTIIVGTKSENILRDYPTNVRISALKADCRWKPSFYVFKFARLTPIVFPQFRQAKFLRAHL